MLNLGSHLLVDQMQAESVSGSLHLVDQIADGLDAFHLLSEVLGLKEVAEVAVALISGHLVQVEKALVDRLLQLSSLHGFKWSSPFHGGRLGDVQEDNSPASLGLVFHQLHAMGALLPGLRLEVFSKSVEGLILPVEVGAHGKKNVRGIEFHVDLLVDQCLAVLPM